MYSYVQEVKFIKKKPLKKYIQVGELKKLAKRIIVNTILDDVMFKKAFSNLKWVAEKIKDFWKKKIENGIG